MLAKLNRWFHMEMIKFQTPFSSNKHYAKWLYSVIIMFLNCIPSDFVQLAVAPHIKVFSIPSLEIAPLAAMFLFQVHAKWDPK